MASTEAPGARGASTELSDALAALKEHVAAVPDDRAERVALEEICAAAARAASAVPDGSGATEGVRRLMEGVQGAGRVAQGVKVTTPTKRPPLSRGAARGEFYGEVKGGVVVRGKRQRLRGWLGLSEREKGGGGLQRVGSVKKVEEGLGGRRSTVKAEGGGMAKRVESWTEGGLGGRRKSLGVSEHLAGRASTALSENGDGGRRGMGTGMVSRISSKLLGLDELEDDDEADRRGLEGSWVAGKRLEEIREEVAAAAGLLRVELRNSDGGRGDVRGRGGVGGWGVRGLWPGGRAVLVAGGAGEVRELAGECLKRKSGRRLVVAAGRSGNGRAAAVCLVARSKVCSARFADGVIWLRVAAKGAGVGEGVQTVRVLCDSLVGTGLATEELRGIIGAARGGAGYLEDVVGNVLRAVKERFARKEVMIVLEGDAGTSAASAWRLVNLLREIIQVAADGSVLVAITEYSMVSKRADAAVVFPDLVEGDEAVREVYHAFSGEKRSASKWNDIDAAQTANIASAGGVPLALALASNASRVGGEIARKALAAPLPDSLAGIVGVVASEADIPLPLSSAITAVLRLLDTSDCGLDSLTVCVPAKERRYSWTDMFLALSVTDTDSSPSLAVLARLWGIRSVAYVRAVSVLWTSLGLAAYKDGRLHLHPAHVAYCRARCACDDSVASEGVWHLRLLSQLSMSRSLAPVAKEEAENAHVAVAMRRRAVAAKKIAFMIDVPTDMSNAAKTGPLSEVPWRILCDPGTKSVPENSIDPVYFANNIVRHLCRSVGGGMVAAAALMSDYRFIDDRCSRFGLSAVKRDFRILGSEAAFARAALHGSQALSLEIYEARSKFLESLREEAVGVVRALDLMPGVVTGSARPTSLSIFGMEDTGPHASARPVVGDQGLANQLQSRLPENRDFCCRLVKSVAEHASRPWLRSMTDHLEQPGEGLEGVIRPGNGTVTALAVSSDASFVVSGTVTGELQLHDIVTGRCIQKLTGHTAQVHDLCVAEGSPTKIISASWDGSVRVWDATNGASISVLTEHEDQVFAVAATANGEVIASGSMDKTVVVFRNGCSVGSSLDILEGHTDWVRSVALSSDGKMVFSGGDDTTARIWVTDPDGGGLICRRVLRGHSSRVSSLAVSSDDRTLVSGGYDGSLRVTDVETGALRQVFAGPSGKQVYSVAVPHGQGSIFATYSDGISRVWGLNSRKGKLPLVEFGNGLMAGHLAAFKDGSRVISSSLDGSLRVWMPPSLLRAGQLKSGAAGGSPSSIIRGGPQKPIYSPNIPASTLIFNAPLVRPFHTKPVASITASADGDLVASGSWDKDVRIWNVLSGRCDFILKGHAHAVSALAFSGNSQHIISGSHDESLKVWSVKKGLCEQTMYDNKGPITCVAVSVDSSRIVSGSEEGTVRLWNREKGFRKDKALRNYDVPVLAVALSWNGSVGVSLAASGTCVVFDASGGTSASVICLSSIKFSNFRFGPSTAASVLEAYTLKRKLPSSTSANGLDPSGASQVASSVDTGYKCAPAKLGPGLEVWKSTETETVSSSSSSDSLEDGGIACKMYSGDEPEGGTVTKNCAAAYVDSAMGREKRVWTSVFSNSAGQKFVAQGMCTGSLSILEIIE